MIIRKLFKLENTLVFLMALSILVVANKYSNAITTMDWALEETLSHYQYAFRARISDRKPIKQMSNGVEYICGWLLRVNIIENYKGYSKDGTILTNHKEVYIGNENEYLVFAWKNPHYGSPLGRSHGRCMENKELKFDTDSYRYLSGYGSYQSIFPIEQTSSRKIENDRVLWMDISNLAQIQGATIIVDEPIEIEMKESYDIPHQIGVSELNDILRWAN